MARKFAAPAGTVNPVGSAGWARDRLLASRDDAGNCTAYLLPLSSSRYYAEPRLDVTFGIQLGRGSDAHSANVVLCRVDNEVAKHQGLRVGDVVVGALGELFDATTDWRQVNHQILVREHLEMPLDLIVRLDAASVVERLPRASYDERPVVIEMRRTLGGL